MFLVDLLDTRALRVPLLFRVLSGKAWQCARAGLDGALSGQLPRYLVSCGTVYDEIYEISRSTYGDEVISGSRLCAKMGVSLSARFADDVASTSCSASHCVPGYGQFDGC